MKAKTKRLPFGKRRERSVSYATTFQVRSQVDDRQGIRPDARSPNCQTEINPGERGFYYANDKALYGTRCGHGEKAKRDFNAHWIDEDGY